MALDARTGRKVWAFQLVHHDVWDYDVAAEPLLFDFHGTPAVAVAAKTSILFVLNRLTGEPLVPVQERAVPQGGVLGEKLSPTQPFSSLPTINALTFDPGDLTGLDSESARTCEAQLRKLRYDGIFTPPTLVGTLQYPGSLGGVNWGSMSLDPLTGVLYANTNGSAYEIRLLKRPGFMALTARLLWVWIVAAALLMLLGALLRRRVYPGSAITVFACALIAAGFYFQRDATFHFERRHNMVNSPDSVGELSANSGAPYQTYRRVLQDDAGHPCTPQPWGSTGAVDLAVGKLLWRKPLGTMIASEHTGTVNFGAPIVTAGGLLFTAASSEPLLRAIDKDTGDELWTGRLPVPAQSTPMTYMAGGRQYVVVGAGGHGGLGTSLGDSVVAFALPNAGGAGVRMSR